MTETTTAEEAKASVAADLLADHLDAIQANTKEAGEDPGLAAEGMDDAELAEYVAVIQDIRHHLGLVERDLIVALGKRLGKAVGNLEDGRQFKLERSTDRREWNHDDWKRDVRRAVVQQILDAEGLPTRTPVSVVDIATGEEREVSISRLLLEAITAAQEVHGATSPKTTALKGLGLYASNYCTSSPAGWRFTALRPTTTQEDTTDA